MLVETDRVKLTAVLPNTGVSRLTNWCPLPSGTDAAGVAIRDTVALVSPPGAQDQARFRKILISERVRYVKLQTPWLVQLNRISVLAP